MEITGTAQHEAWLARAVPPVEQLRDGLLSIPVPMPGPLRYVTWSRPWEQYERRMRIFAVTETDAHLRLMASRGLVAGSEGPVPTWTLAAH